jgi:hypothetical protein
VQGVVRYSQSWLVIDYYALVLDTQSVVVEPAFFFYNKHLLLKSAPFLHTVNDDMTASLEPFEAMPFDLSRLWV